MALLFTSSHMISTVLRSCCCSLPELCGLLGIPPEAILSHQSTHIAASLLLLTAPAAAALAVESAATRWHLGSSSSSNSNAANAAAAHSDGSSSGSVSGLNAFNAAATAAPSEVPFLRMAYSLLPLVWAASLAYYEGPLFTELGLVLPRLALTFGAAGDAEWVQGLPALSPAAAAVVSAAQGSTLLLGCALSCALAGQIAAAGVGGGGQQQNAALRDAVVRQRVMAVAVTLLLWNVML
jgi:hypothetical protein